MRFFKRKEKVIKSEQNIDDIMALFKRKSEENILVLGTAGSGRCHHPWDNLKPCLCGCKERPLLMYEKDKLYFCGGTRENVFAICSVCGRHTEKTDLTTTIHNWNNDNTVFKS